MSADASPDSSPPPASNSRHRAGWKALLVLVAVLGALVWAALEVRDRSRPALALVRALRSSQIEDRRAAGQGLIGLSPDDARMVIAPLNDALGDPDEAANLNILLALGEAGITAAQDPTARPEARLVTEAMTRALADPREPIRTQAAGLLQSFARLSVGKGGPIYDSAAVAALARVALDDPEPKTRLAATQALVFAARHATTTPPAALITALARPDRPGAIRGAAAALLGAFPVGQPAAVAPLAAALGDHDPKVRWGAAVGLALLGRAAIRPAIPALLPLLDEPLGDPTQYRSPELVLAWMPSPPALEVINLAAKPLTPVDRPAYDTWDPARMAAVAVGKVAGGQEPDDRAVEALTRMLASEKPWRREAAASALSQIGPNAAPAVAALIDALREAIPAPDSELLPRSELVSSLAQTLADVAPQSPLAAAAVGVLTQALTSPSPTTTYWAATALGDFGTAGTPALPALRELTSSPDPYIATRAGEAVAAIEHPKERRHRPNPGGPGG